MLHAWLQERRGDIRHSANIAGGTTAVAYWRADLAHGHGLTDREFLAPG
jgi:hypothetical protein